MKSAFVEYFESLRGKKVGVLGLGVSNRPLVRLLLEFDCQVIGCDKTEREQLDAEVLELEKLGCKLQLGVGYLENLDVELLFRTPGMHPNHPALMKLREQGVKITSEMQVFFDVCPCEILAVTGSDGKTTTTTLIAEMLKAAGKTVWVGGNIGAPLLPRCREMKKDDYAVVELSSFQLMDMHTSPHIAVVTNLAPNHLDVHKDMEEYVEAKQNIYRYQNPEDVLVLNGDNEITKEFSGNGRTEFFSRKNPDARIYSDGVTVFRCGKPVLKAEDILLPGVHNLENYMAAIAAVEGIVPDDVICHVAKNFGGVEHRIELVRVKDGVRYYNDSIASSPSRTIAGLRSFREKVILIAGGYDKHIPYDVLGPEICKHVKKLYLNGTTAPLIRSAVESCPEYSENHPEIRDCGDFRSAVLAAASAAEAGDIVLMSPASASFDQFKNFMLRGDAFKKIVKEL